jgi:hypothetical protein
MAARLKVYRTRIGFHDAVVAAPNQKAALAAWDVRENLFAQGAATTTDDPKAVEAATAHPGVVLRRPAGSDQPFSESPAAPEVPKIGRPKTENAAKAKTETKPPPDRRDVDAAEKALVALEEEEKRTLDDLDRRRRDLDAEARGCKREFATRRKTLQTEHDRALRIYRREGGT